MDTNQIWKSKEIKRHSLLILGKNPDGSIIVTFDFNHISPGKTHNFQPWYLEQFYEKTEETLRWTIDSSLKQFA
jgi:hypothetical protein